MNQAVKTLWVAALRSGNYRQGKYLLRRYVLRLGLFTEIRYCPLGVLCDLYAACHADAVWTRLEEGKYSLEREGARVTRATALPPPEVCSWADMQNEAFINGITSLNDVAGFSFGQIADVIEQGSPV